MLKLDHKKCTFFPNLGSCDFNIVITFLNVCSVLYLIFILVGTHCFIICIL